MNFFYVFVDIFEKSLYSAANSIYIVNAIGDLFNISVMEVYVLFKSPISLDKTRVAGLFIKSITLKCSFILLVLLAKNAYANEDLFPLEGARPLAMGGAFIAVSDDYNAIFYNPAGLEQIKQKYFGYNLSYQSYDIDYPYIDFPLEKPNHYYLNQSLNYAFSKFGVSFVSIAEGDNKNPYLKADNDVDISEVKDISKTNVIYLSFGQRIWNNILGGITAKIFSTRNDFFMDDSQKGMAINLGSIIIINSQFSTGLLIENILASKKQYILHRYNGSSLGFHELPVKVDIGLSYKPKNNLLLAIDIKNLFEDKVSSFGNEEIYKFKRSYHLGGEYGLTEDIYLRAGIKQESQIKPYQTSIYKTIVTYSGGMGIKKGVFSTNVLVSYANIDKNEIFRVDSPWKYGFSLYLNF